MRCKRLKTAITLQLRLFPKVFWRHWMPDVRQPCRGREVTWGSLPTASLTGVRGLLKIPSQQALPTQKYLSKFLLMKGYKHLLGLHPCPAQPILVGGGNYSTDTQKPGQLGSSLYPTRPFRISLLRDQAKLLLHNPTVSTAACISRQDSNSGTFTPACTTHNLPTAQGQTAS